MAAIMHSIPWAVPDAPISMGVRSVIKAVSWMNAFAVSKAIISFAASIVLGVPIALAALGSFEKSSTF